VIKPLWQILTFPPFIALMIATVIGMSQITYHSVIKDVLDKLAATLVPLALIAVGFQLRLTPSVLKRYWKPLSLGITFKLVIIPAFFLLCYQLFLPELNFLARVTLIESAMATMITAAVVASDFNLDEELANLMVGVSIPLSLLTVPLWFKLIS